MTTHELSHRARPARRAPGAGSAYYGIHTLRALENFPITGTPISIYPELINALACVKQAAAHANQDLGSARRAHAGAIIQACREIRAGELHRAVRRRRDPGRRRHLDQHERQRGHRQPRARAARATRRANTQHLHPMDHVNLSQSTNDVYPTAINVALRFGLERLLRRWPACAANSSSRRKSSPTC